MPSVSLCMPRGHPRMYCNSHFWLHSNFHTLTLSIGIKIIMNNSLIISFLASKTEKLEYIVRKKSSNTFPVICTAIVLVKSGLFSLKDSIFHPTSILMTWAMGKTIAAISLGTCIFTLLQCHGIRILFAII